MKKIISMLFILTIFATLFSTQIKADIELCKNARSAILIDENTGTILYEKNKDFRLAPASMTKIMTLAIIFDYIRDGNLKLTDLIVTSEHANSMGGTQIYLEVGERMSLDDLLKAICIASANDAAVAVGEKIAGSEEIFVSLMNKKAQELGLKNTNFMDATGLETTNHYTSAYDMAMIAKYLLNNYKEDVLKYTSLREDYLRKNSASPFWLVNTNKLIGKYEGVDGLKTGWTNAAGYCLTSTMHKDGNRLISVVMGYEVPTIRNNETVELLNYGFANYKFKDILPQGHLVAEIKNIRFNPSTIKIVTARKISSVEKMSNSEDEFAYEIELLEINKEYKEGEVVGKYLVYRNGKLYDTIDLIVESDVKTNNFFELLWEVIILVLT